MFEIIKKGSRILIIYLATVIVSLAMLIYLSVINVFNYRELTAKKILEEEFRMTQLFSEIVQQKLDSLKAFSYHSESTDNACGPDSSLINKLDAGIGFRFLMLDSGGQILCPIRYIDKASFNYRPVKSSLQSLILQAQKAEFNQKNVDQAFTLYELALKLSDTRIDSARLFNAIGRLNYNIGNEEKGNQRSV